jgi:hypothetical protein
MSAIEILAVIGIIGYIIFRQVQGEPLRGKRAVLLPAILTVVGFANLRGGGAHLTADDIACLVVGAAGSAVIGLVFGAIMRLESRGGFLWAQLPLRGLWLWAALVAWRVVAILVATALHAHIAASTATLLLSLGVNRLAAAAVIVARAMAMGVPFAPEKDGKVFMAGTFDRGFGARDGLGARFGRGGDEGRRGFNGRDGQGAWRGVPGGRLRRGGPGSASAEDLAGDSRSKFQRYLILLLEWPLRRRGEDHRVPSGASYTTIQTIRTLHRDAPQTRVVPGTLTPGRKCQMRRIDDLELVIWLHASAEQPRASSTDSIAPDPPRSRVTRAHPGSLRPPRPQEAPGVPGYPPRTPLPRAAAATPCGQPPTHSR